MSNINLDDKGSSLLEIAKSQGQISLDDMAKVEELAALQHQLKDVLKERFALNLEAFRKYMPEIADAFENYKPKRPFDFFCTDNGIPNLIYTDTNEILYPAWNPADLCKAQIQRILKNVGFKQTFYDLQGDPYGQIHFKYTNQAVKISKETEKRDNLTCAEFGSMPNAMLLGVGLGYSVGEIFASIEMANLVIVEPELDMFYASLHAFTWYDLLPFIFENHYGIHLMIGSEDHQLFLDIENFYKRHGRFLSGSFIGIIHTSTPKIRKIAQIIDKQYSAVFSALGFFDDHLFGTSHACRAILDKKHFVKLDTKLPNKYKNVPVFIIGSGPSLDNDIPFLRKNQDKAIIIACGTAIDTLYHAGIKPDFYACTERTPQISEALSIIPDKHFLDDIILLTGDVVHPKTTAMFKHTAIFGKMDEPFFEYAFSNLKGFGNVKLVQMMNPLVGNMGVSGALYLGFTNLYLFGLDNGTKIDTTKMHSKYTSLYHDHGTNDQNGNYVAKDIVDGNFGSKCRSGYFFKMCARNMAFILDVFKREKPELSCFNCSDGVLIDNATPKHSEDLDFSKKADINKDKFKDFINNELTSQLDISLSDIKAIFSPKIFKETCLRIEQLLKKPYTNRIEFIQNLESVSEVLYFLRQNNNTSYYGQCLSGTLQNIFIIATRELYAKKDESYCLKQVQRILDLCLDFLNEAPSLFEKLPNYVLGDHQSYFKDGKVGADTSYGEAPKQPVIAKLVHKEFDDPQKVFEKKYE